MDIFQTVKNYFTGYTVGSIMGFPKVSLIEADNYKKPTGFSVEIDATSSVEMIHSRTLMQHSAESKKVYMDGSKRNPIKCSIQGTIDANKIPELERLAKDDTWVYVALVKNMGGAYLTMRQDTVGAIKRIAGRFGLIDDNPNQLYTDANLFIISDLVIREEGFKNTVSVSIELKEVVMFEYDLQYKFGVKRVSGGKTKKVQQTTAQEVPKEKWSTRFDKRGVEFPNFGGGDK